MAAPPPVQTCALTPAPASWAAVPPEDHDRLNTVILAWNRDVLPMDFAELLLDDANGYQLQIMPHACDVVTADNMERIRKLRHVIGVECNMNVRVHSARCHGAVCVYVRSAAKDFADGGYTGAVDIAPPLGGTSYTQILRATCPQQLDALCDVARAAAL